MTDSPSASVVRILAGSPFLRAATIGLFFSGIAVGATMPQMTLFMVEDLHASLSVAGLYYLVNLAAPLAGYALGALSDRMDDRLVAFRACAVVGALGWAGLAFATQLWMPFVIGATALSVGGAAMGLLFAAVRDELTRRPTHATTRVMSAVRMAFTGGWIIGPVLGSWFGAAFGLRALLLATAACSLAQIVPLGLQRVERVRMTSEDDGPRVPGSDLGPLLVYLTGIVLLMCGDTIKFGYLPLYMDVNLHTSDTMRGAVIAAQPFVELSAMPLFARLAERLSAIWVVVLGGVLGVGANVAYAISESVTGLFVGQILMSGLWAAMAGLGIVVAQQLTPQRVGLASSLFSSCIPLSGALGGVLGALGVGWLGLPRVFFLPAALAVLGLAVLVFASRRYRPDEAC